MKTEGRCGMKERGKGVKGGKAECNKGKREGNKETGTKWDEGKRAASKEKRKRLTKGTEVVAFLP